MVAILPSSVTSLPTQISAANSGVKSRSTASIPSVTRRSSADVALGTEKCLVSALEFPNCVRRRQILVGLGAFASVLSPSRHALAEEVPKDYQPFVDFIDGYTYVYPADWRYFDFTGHDSAFKDRFAALQNVRVRFIPTDKKDVHDLGTMEEVVFDLVKNIYAAPNQTPTVYEMKERTVDGKNYWTFEYELSSPNFARTAFATIGIGNGRYYTLIVGANERRWSRVRNKMKVVADSFKILDI